ncbi:MAG: RNA polymerase sigma factor [Cyclobacteriaceae bacterium]|nr:RNA polymerase sigma factor [Cyclobacteriaceae bacterium]
MYTETLLDIAMRHSEAIILKAQKGDNQAFNKLVALWYKRIYNLALKYFSGHDMAMEATQRTFISVHKGLPKLRDTERFRSWIYRIAVNVCHEEERKLKRQAISIDGVPEKGKVTIQLATYGPEKSLQQQELSSLLLEALKEINQEQRMVVIMKEYEGMKFREIAEVLDISENTVKSRMYYGLSALRKILETRNITKEVYYEL